MITNRFVFNHLSAFPPVSDDLARVKPLQHDTLKVTHSTLQGGGGGGGGGFIIKSFRYVSTVRCPLTRLRNPREDH